MSKVRYETYYRIFSNVRNTFIQREIRRVKHQLFQLDQETGIYDHLTMLAVTDPLVYPSCSGFSIN